MPLQNNIRLQSSVVFGSAVVLAALLLFGVSMRAAHAQVPITPQQALADVDSSRVMVLTSTGPVLLSDLNSNTAAATIPGVPNTGVSDTSTGMTAIVVPGIPNTGVVGTITINPIVVAGPSGTYIGSGFGSRQDVRVIDSRGKDLGIYRADISGVVVIGAFPPGVAQAPLTLIGL